MRFYKGILILLYLLGSNKSIACECESQGPFLTVAPKSKLVALVKVNRYLSFLNISNKPTPILMEVEIIKIFRGQETKKIIEVWGDTGGLCRPNLNTFKIDNFYVIAFQKSSDTSKTSTDKEEMKSPYVISNCGEYWLTADNVTKFAFGRVSKNQTSIDYEELMVRLNDVKTNKLLPKDFKEIFQLVLDLPELQQYYRVEKDSTRKNVFIVDLFGVLNQNNLLGVKKFGLQVNIATFEEIKKQNIKNYFVLEEWCWVKESLLIHLGYIGDMVTASCALRLIDGKWEIENYELWLH